MHLCKLPKSVIFTIFISKTLYIYPLYQDDRSGRVLAHSDASWRMKIKSEQVHQRLRLMTQRL